MSRPAGNDGNGPAGRVGTASNETELTAVASLAAQVKEYAKHVGGYSVDLDEFVEVPTPFDPVTGEIVEQ